MRKILILSILILLPGGYLLKGERGASIPESYTMYVEMGLEGVVDYAAFEQALAGAGRAGARRKEIITLIDFTKPSTEKRLYVLDLERRRMLFHSLVAHGRNSGENYATSFSNVSGSYKSSLGFYLTGDTYQGGNGYSLALDGLEKGINDRARERAIVIHGADYCNPSLIASMGRLGRSFGCPALPRDVAGQIIDAIKGGTLLYIYARDPQYLTQSTFIPRPSAC